MANNEQKNFNVNVNVEVADEFSEQTEQRGYTKYRAVEGALRAFIAMPAELQVRLISAGSQDEVYQLLIENLLKAEISKHLEKLGPTRAKFLALLKQAKDSSSQKK